MYALLEPALASGVDIFNVGIGGLDVGVGVLVDNKLVLVGFDTVTDVLALAGLEAASDLLVPGDGLDRDTVETVVVVIVVLVPNTDTVLATLSFLLVNSLDSGTFVGNVLVLLGDTIFNASFGFEGCGNLILVFNGVCEDLTIEGDDELFN